MAEIIKKYQAEGVTVVWQPALCSHSKKCFDGLPEVFNPENRPWVQVEASDPASIIAQVKQCPSGALSIEGLDELDIGTEPAMITVIQGGPLIVKGEVLISLADGTQASKSGVTALCRCGTSSNKPFCDGSHAKVDFDS